jgi:hypothetical protein
MGNTLIGELIAKAAERARRQDAERAVTWIYRGGWRIAADHFDELLEEYRHLTAEDVAELRAFKESLAA